MTISSDDPLDTPLYFFSEYDAWTCRDAVEGSVIMGSSGSGKTSAAGKALLVSLLRSGFGGFCIAAKNTDTQHLKECMALAGRSLDDLIHFAPGSGHCFDGLAYLWARPGGRMLENIIELIRLLIEIANPHAGSGGDRFFDLAANQLVRNAIVLLSLAGRPISIVSINNLIDALPTMPGEFEQPEFQQTSELTAILEAIRRRRESGSLSESEWEDFAAAQYFAVVRWPGMYPETRTSIHATWGGLADQFMFDPLRSAFGSARCTFVPEQAETGKVILCDWPALSYGETGRVIGCLLKLVFQIAWTTRRIAHDTPLVWFLSDEAPLYLLPGDKDSAFQAVCRGSRVATLFILQSIHGIASRLGENQPGSRTKGWLSNVALKVFLQNSCSDTNLFAADLIGKDYRLRSSYSGKDNISVGGQEHLDHLVHPHEFMQLLKPNSACEFAEAVVVKGGEPFWASGDEHTRGRNYLSCMFTRNPR